MLSWWLTAALDPDFRQIQYFFLSNTEEFTPHRPSRSVAIAVKDELLLHGDGTGHHAAMILPNSGL